MSIRRTLAAVCLVLAASAAGLGQSRIPDAVRETVDEGASLYRAGRFVEAQEHFERALRDAPESGTIAIFLARAVQRQYKPGRESAENRAKGEEAVAAYERVLRLAGGDQWLAEDAYKAVVFLHGQMRNEEKVREMLWWRAHDESVAAGKRSEAFVILASKQ